MDKQTLLNKIPALETSGSFGRSAKYNNVNTARIVDLMERQGFQVSSAQQKRSIKEEKRPYAKHILRFRSADAPALNSVGDSIPEIVLINSHDGTCAYNMLAGIFRLVCSNGLIVASSTIACIKIRHNNRNIGADVIQGAYTIMNQTNKLSQIVNLWSNIHLTPDQQKEYFKGAKAIYDPNNKIDMAAGQLLYTYRQADKDPTLWNTFNILQERFIRGGFRAYNQTNGHYRRAREVSSIDRQVKINTMLWKYTEDFKLN